MLDAMLWPGMANKRLTIHAHSLSNGGHDWVGHVSWLRNAIQMMSARWSRCSVG